MSMAVKYIQEVDIMANNVLEVLVESDNIPYTVFLRAANMIDRWRSSTIELIYLMESGTCLEFDILLDKYECHLNECLFCANNYERD